MHLTDSDQPRRPAKKVLLLLLIGSLLTVGAACGADGARTRPATSRRSAASGSHPAQRDLTSTRHWLGLNYNSGSGVGSVSQFVRDGVIWDREGHLEAGAGYTPEGAPAYGHALNASLAAGMVPDVLVDPTDGTRGCTSNPNTSGICLPNTPVQINRYVQGFVRTMVTTIQAHPKRLVVFEPMDEPWDWASPPGSTPGTNAATQYAATLARLMAALRRAHAPLSRVFVPFTGVLADGSEWLDDLYRAQPCLAPGRHTCGPIEGWNAHVYGTPRSSTNSLGVISGLRDRMRSGAGNVIVSELGFCATNVERGQGCGENTPEVDGTSATVSGWLGEALRIAASMHNAGWLKAVILWDRSGGGWSLQLPDGQLTAQGETLVRFARAHSQ